MPVTYVHNVQYVVSCPTQSALLFLDNIPEQIKWARATLTTDILEAIVVLD